MQKYGLIQISYYINISINHHIYLIYSYIQQNIQKNAYTKYLQIHFCKYAHNYTLVYFIDVYICVLFAIYTCELYACVYYNHKYPLPYTYLELVFTDKNKLHSLLLFFLQLYKTME